MRQFFKSKRGGKGGDEEETKNRTKTVNQTSLSITRAENRDQASGKGMDNKRNTIFSHIQQLNGHAYIDDDDETPPPIRATDTRPAPHWLDGPRDATVLPDIIASTYSDYSDEADYAMKQMLAILETLNPTEETMELFESSLKAIDFRLPFDIILNEHKKPNWNAIHQKLLADSIRLTPSAAESSEHDRPGLSTVQMSAVFDAIPFLFDAVACNHELEKYQNTLSMIVLIAMTGNSMIRRQSINAIQALMERSMLSQDFMCDGIVPGLFHIYQSGVGAFQSNDLRMECVQALCQVISYNTIHDRRWIFRNFLPKFSQMLKDPTMHVRKMKNSQSQQPKQQKYTTTPTTTTAKNDGVGGGVAAIRNNRKKCKNSDSTAPSSSSTSNNVVLSMVPDNNPGDVYILQSALHIFGNLGNLFGQKFTEVFLVPHLITLSCDMTWAVRKVACEVFVKVAECASNEVRVETLSPNFVRLLNDPNKWVSFIAYQQLGPFISLFANPDITGLDLKNGEVVVREIPPPPSSMDQTEQIPKMSEPPPPEADAEFGVLPPNTWLPEVDLLDDFEYQLAMNEAAVAQLQKDATTAVATTTPTTPSAKTTPKRGERVMDSVLSGINKMFSPFERSSPKSKEVEKITATFSSPSKRSPLSLHSAVSLMDKWSKRSNPNNPQRFPVFDNTNATATTPSDAKESTTSSSKDSQKPLEGSGIAAKCNSTDDLTKLGLEDDEGAKKEQQSKEEHKEEEEEDSESTTTTKTASPRGRRIATNAWTKLDIRQKLFLRRLGALPPTAAASTTAVAKRKALSPRLSPTRVKSPKSLVSARRRGGAAGATTPTRTTGGATGSIFNFAPPTEIGGEAPPLFAAPVLKLGTEEEKEKEKIAEEEAKKDQYSTSTATFAMAPVEGANAADREADANEDSGDDCDDNDNDDDFDKSFVADDEDDEDDAPLMIDVKPRSESVSANDLTEQKAQQEPVSTEFSLTYWSSNYAISSILDDELKPFGSSSAFTNSPTSNSYLESRFDVMRVSGASPRARSQSFGTNGSPIALSPRRKANSTSEETASPPTTALLDVSRSDDSVAMLNTEEKEKLGILDIDEMNMSISSSSSLNGEAGHNEDSDVSLTSMEQAAFQHVPSDLVESYMKVMGPNGHTSGSVATGDASLCAEIYRHCAHNFPAICFTLGRAAWPRLNLVFRKLAMDEQARVRQSISYSIHEIANMLGQEIADEDLLPVFYDLRNDQNSDVRNGILMHLYDFVKCLSVEKRNEMILSLPQFFPIGAQPGNQAQNGDWRSRFELISQLSKLCSLYSIQDVNLHMSGIALTLADDRVAEVRREAVMLVSTIVGALVSAEWAELCQTRDIENGHVDAKNNKKAGQTTFLSEQFVDDIVSSFAKTQKWTRRQTFCFICAQILRDKQCDGIQFRYFFSVPLQNLVQDKVPNVRLASCEAMSVWRKTLIAARSAIRGPSPISSPSSTTTRTSSFSSPESAAASIRRDINLVSDMMVRLANDSDIDAAYLAKKCQGLTDDQQPVDIEARTMRMREREEAQFGDVIMSDAAGNLVKYIGGKFVAVVKHAFNPAEHIKELVTGPVKGPSEKEAPLQSMDEFDEEILSHKEQQALATPPPEYQATVVQIAIASLEDNRDEVDMEIDEEEDDEEEVVMAVAQGAAAEKSVEEKAEEPRRKTEEADVPMDPAPSAPETPKTATPSSSIKSPSTSSSSVVAIQIEEESPSSPEDSEA